MRHPAQQPSPQSYLPLWLAQTWGFPAVVSVAPPVLDGTTPSRVYCTSEPEYSRITQQDVRALAALPKLLDLNGVGPSEQVRDPHCRSPRSRAHIQSKLNRSRGGFSDNRDDRP